MASIESRTVMLIAEVGLGTALPVIESLCSTDREPSIPPLAAELFLIQHCPERHPFSLSAKILLFSFQAQPPWQSALQSIIHAAFSH